MARVEGCPPGGIRPGSGVPGILAVREPEGWRKPEVQEQYNPDRTILTLTLTTRNAEKVSKKMPEPRHRRTMAGLMCFRARALF